MNMVNPKKNGQPNAIEMHTPGDKDKPDGGDKAIDQPKAPDCDDDDGESPSEAVIKFTIENFSRQKLCVSPPVVVRDVQWRIKAVQRNVFNQNDGSQQRGFGFFLQCDGDGRSVNWSCFANAELRLISQKEGVKNLTKRIEHNFNTAENDWGFSHFMPWKDVTNSKNGYIKNDTVILEVYMSADLPYGITWDSKKRTGFVGLKNQGATCYMNSLLQTLYFTNQLRKAVYSMPTEGDDSARSVGMALQSVFYELQFSDEPVGTEKLTKSFGWNTEDAFLQQDVQEFLRVLLDNLESKMKGTCVDGEVPKLFEGKTSSFIKCKYVDYASSRIETYYDIQLGINGMKNIYESFRDYVTTETLDGNNKYDAGLYGLQEADKGVVFQTFPPVLHLHLMRFQYDPATGRSVKSNDRFEFYEKLDLTDFLQGSDPAVRCLYTLHAVLVHSGDNRSGHYVVFINPKGDGKWCKFDDDMVSKCSKKEAIDNNFGGTDEGSKSLIKKCTSAYMLVYIKDSELQTVLQEIAEADIPQELVKKLNEERRQDAIRRKKESEAHLFMEVHLIFEDQFKEHQGFDLFDEKITKPTKIQIQKTQTVEQAIKAIANALKLSPGQIRFWPIDRRSNHAVRPRALDQEEFGKTLFDVAKKRPNLQVFCELPRPDSKNGLKNFHAQTDISLFFKHYDPTSRKLKYVGHFCIPLATSLRSVVPALNRRVGFAPNTELLLFEEIEPSVIEEIEDLDRPINRAHKELVDGDIIVFQKKDPKELKMKLGLCRDYYKDLLLRVHVTFCDKNNENDSGFTIELSQKMNYGQVAQTVAQHLRTKPDLLRFFEPHAQREGFGHAVQSTFDGILEDILKNMQHRQRKRLYYEHLTIPIKELENKNQIKCSVVDSNYKEETEIVLYPNKNSSIGEMLEEAKEIVSSLQNCKAELQLVEISSCKISRILHPHFSTDHLVDYIGNGLRYRIEEAIDEAKLAKDEVLVPVAHFSKEASSTFGIPLLFVIKDKELYSDVRTRLQKKLDIPDNEFEKYKMAIVVQHKIKFVGDDAKSRVDLTDFKSNDGQEDSPFRPWLGLQHRIKSEKSSRYPTRESAIKIYN